MNPPEPVTVPPAISALFESSTSRPVIVAVSQKSIKILLGPTIMGLATSHSEMDFEVAKMTGISNPTIVVPVARVRYPFPSMEFQSNSDNPAVDPLADFVPSTWNVI